MVIQCQSPRVANHTYAAKKIPIALFEINRAAPLRYCQRRDTRHVLPAQYDSSSGNSLNAAKHYSHNFPFMGFKIVNTINEILFPRSITNINKNLSLHLKLTKPSWSMLVLGWWATQCQLVPHSSVRRLSRGLASNFRNGCRALPKYGCMHDLTYKINAESIWLQWYYYFALMTCALLHTFDDSRSGAHCLLKATSLRCHTWESIAQALDELTKRAFSA